MATRADLERLDKALDRAADMAAKDFDAFAARLDLAALDPAVARDALGEVMDRLLTRYGDISAASAADWYDALRDVSAAGDGFTAVLADGLSPEQVERTTRWAARGLFDGDPEDTLDKLRNHLTRSIVAQGKRTVEMSAAADPARPRWARVPGPGGCCAWCSMLASRGFVYATKATAGGEGHSYHHDCHCVPTPLWRGQKPRIDGYDPKALRATYDEARAAVKASGAAVDDKAIAAEMRRIAPESFTDGVAPAE